MDFHRRTTGSLFDAIESASPVSIMPGATVDVLDVATNARRSTTTGSRGEYAVPNLPPGGRARSSSAHEQIIGVESRRRRGASATSVGKSQLSYFASGADHLVGAAAGARFLQGMLLGVTPLDPKTFMAVSLMFGLMARFASYVPAHRVTKVDPMVP
jgi:hypothetical protein